MGKQERSEIICIRTLLYKINLQQRLKNTSLNLALIFLPEQIWQILHVHPTTYEYLSPWTINR